MPTSNVGPQLQVTPLTTHQSPAAQVGAGNSGDKKGVIPVHEIIKSRDSPPSLGQQGPTVQRLESVVPQLSPLSQPNELKTNVTNVSQQLCSIMYSINPMTTMTTSKIEPKLETIDKEPKMKTESNILAAYL